MPTTSSTSSSTSKPDQKARPEISRSQVGTPASLSGRAAELTGPDRRSSERRHEAMAWVAQHMPAFVDGSGIQGYAAHALLRGDRAGEGRSAENVKRRMKSIWPGLAEQWAEIRKRGDA